MASVAFVAIATGVATVVTAPMKMNLDTKNIHKLQMMFWKTYLDPFKDAYSFGLSLYFFLGGDPCKPIAWPFVHWGFCGAWRQRATLVGQREGRAIRDRWSDGWIQGPQEAEEKRQELCNAEIGCGSDKEGKTWKKTWTCVVFRG